MRKYCVWDWNRMAYRVYRAPGEVDAGWNAVGGKAGAGPRIHGEVDVESALPLLPNTAKFIGWSAQAIGQVCQLPRLRHTHSRQSMGSIPPLESEGLVLIAGLLVGAGIGSIGGAVLKSALLVLSGYFLGRRQ